MATPGITNAISNIPVEIFAAYIIEKLRKTNPHVHLATSENQYVLSGSVVHIPQAGNSPDVVKNRKTFPAVAMQRGDTNITYALDVYTTNPTHITWQEGAEINYNKTDSVLNDHVATLIEGIGDNIMYNWMNGLKWNGTAYVPDVLPVANFIRTTGANTPVNASDGQTGQRKAFTYLDLARAEAMMNKQNVAKTSRYCLVESYMYQQLIDSLSSNQMAAFQQTADLKNGVVGRLCGFDIMERSSVLAFTAADAAVLPGQALGATDNLAALCWQKDCVATAQGDIVNFETLKDPLYYGDIFSMLVKIGGRCRRKDWEGLIPVVQA
ncbi:MAG: hypothetical protein LBD53_01130 [Tannerella sp.]|jgi:hypothetical protein|nr:hypothetical protein [Tannerella sp.]